MIRVLDVSFPYFNPYRVLGSIYIASLYVCLAVNVDDGRYRFLKSVHYLNSEIEVIDVACSCFSSFVLSTSM